MIAAELRGVTKRYGATTALDRVEFRVDAGDVVALLGPNGAGKSTALSLLLGLRVPDEGEARLLGGDPRSAVTRRRIGATPQESAYPGTLRVCELVDLVRRHYPSPLGRDEIFARFGLDGYVRRQVGGLSGGQRRRLAVALAFAGAPELVVLDEPTVGLDATARRAVWDAIGDHAAAGGTVLLTTHHLDEAEAVARSVVLLGGGRVAAAGTIAEIKAAAGLARVSFRAPRGAAPAGASYAGGRVRYAVADGGELVARLVHEGVRLDGLEVRPLTLEEALATLERA